MGAAVLFEKRIVDTFIEKNNTIKNTQNPINKYLKALKSLSPEEMTILSDMVEDKD